MKNNYITSSPEETKKLAQKIASELKGGEVICLCGELGAGKTVFVKGVIDYFLPGKRVLSPTFIIVRHYHPKDSIIKDIFHVDLYRISKSFEIQSLGLNEFMNKSDNIVLIEWAERLGKFLPKKRIDIRVKTLSNQSRSIEIHHAQPLGLSSVNEAIEILKQGGIVIYPTDTAFGIGCRIDDEAAVKRLFKIRKRPLTQATPVLVDSADMAQKYFLSPLPDNVRRLMKKFWPGALTIVYPCKKDLVPPLVRGNGENIGCRMPNHEVALKLISRVGVPILGPSANFHGQTTPYSYNELDEELVKFADDIISGECKTGNVSTVVDCSVDPWKILRQGAVTL